MKFSPLLLLLPFLLPSRASSEIIYSCLWDIPIPLNFDGIYLDIDTNLTGSGPIAGWDINIFFGGVGIAGSADFQPARLSTGAEDPVQRLDTGTLIGPAADSPMRAARFSRNDQTVTTAPVSGSGDPSGLSPEVDSAGTDPADQRERTGEIPGESTEQTFEFNALMVATLQYSTGETGSFTHLGAPGNFQDGVEGYLGFRFLRNNGAGPYYGWMRVTLTANTAGAIIHDWAWESSGGSISAGRAPEPASWLSVLAAASIALLRQRQRQR